MKRWRKKLTFVCVVCLVFSIVLNLRALYIMLKSPVIDYLCPVPSWQRKNIIRDVNHVIAQLHIHGGNQPWAKDSEYILSRLLRSIESSSANIIPTATGVVDQSISKRSKVNEICREHYVHANLSQPYFLNGSWVAEKCEYQPMQKLVTLLFNFRLTVDCSQKIDSTLDAVSTEYKNIKAIVAVNAKCDVQQRNNVLFIKFSDKNVKEGEIWNKLIGSVKTPYLWIGRAIDKFSWFNRLERQIAILGDDPVVQIVGGSFRNESGHWEVGCYQSDLRFYQLEYKDGYYASKNECMYCDYLKAPFVARRSLFDAISFDENLDDEVVFEDFFLRMKENAYLLMNCPDVMYFATDKKARRREKDRTRWLALIKKWELNRVRLPDGIVHKYTCEESGSSCEDLQHISGKRFMPVCCMDRLLEGFLAIDQFCRRNNLLYYINGGSLLGAVKFRDIIPWDFDGDVDYFLSNYSVFKKAKSTFGDKTLYFDDFDLKRFGYFRAKLPDIYIEFDGRNDSSIEKSGMASMFRERPTLVRLRGHWLYGPPSPALHIRNMYGDEIFKHANSWAVQGHLWFEPYLVQRHFLPCKDPSHHSCYDKFPTDGSFPFLVP